MNTPLPPPPPKRPPLGDPLLDERLARLAARRSGETPARPAATSTRSAAPAGRTARRHAARGSRAAALALSVTTTVGLAGFLRQAAATEGSSTASVDSSVISGSSATVATTTTVDTATTVDPATPTAAAATAAPETTAPATTAAAAVVADTTSTGLADGTYTGDTATNRWGPVQVEITVSGGVITDVAVLQYPDDDHKSVEINQRALPSLIEEALTAQSADVDTVSGATYTSDSYRDSLQTAIDAARAAINA